MILLGLGSVGYFYGLPLYKYSQAEKQLENGEYDKAHDAFIALGNFKDSPDMAKESLYQKARSLLNAKKYDDAIKLYTELNGYSNSDEMVTECKYQKACNQLESKQYSQAITTFEGISYYKNSSDKINEAMYGYVGSHKNNDDRTTYSYLQSLKKKGYKDSSSIYSDLYDWKISFYCCNTDPDNWTTKNTSISKYCNYLHCGFTIKGGTPGEKITLSNTIVFPDGDTSTADWNWENEYDGSDFGFQFKTGIYSNPSYGKTGTMTIKIYKANTYDLLATFSIKITN